jgi:alpha-beta hydrolase superfamily lysophospholipase
MNRFVRTLARLACVSAIACAALAPRATSAITPARTINAPVAPQAASACEPDGTQASGAKYRICMPAFGWNGNVVIYAHGYIDPTKPIGIPEDQLNLNGTNVPNAVNLLGYGFAMSSYSKNGLAVKEGLADTIDLVRIFKEKYPNTQRVYLIGVSEGGLIATLASERNPQTFSGALALCGPIGDFNYQISHFGDFRVAFDYFFPGIMPGSAISVPQTLIDTWNTGYFSNTVLPAISAPSAALSMTQLFSATRVPIDPAQPATTTLAATAQLLWYNVFSTNDGTQVLGGSPYSNTGKVYSGTLNDSALNAAIARHAAAPAAVAAMNALQTTGRPQIPLVTLHTTGDEIVPYGHNALYASKINAFGYEGRYDHQSAPRWGHCNFTVTEVQTALTTLQSRVSNPPPFNPKRFVWLPGVTH